MKKQKFYKRRAILKCVCNTIAFIGFVIILLAACSVDSVNILTLCILAIVGILLAAGGLTICYKIEDAEEIEKSGR